LLVTEIVQLVSQRKSTPSEAEMVLIPAGPFTMGSDNGALDEKPVHTVNLPAFYMDKYEVTNALYKACVEASGCSKPQDTARYNDSKYANHPVVYVDWDQAKAYCEWRGARLPTEAEWEKAARGTDGRTYPWGEGIGCDKANYSSCKSDTTLVDSYKNGKSPYGLYDMAGNVWEWTADWYDMYPGGDPNASNDFGQKYPVIRGGSWDFNEDYLRVSYRSGNSPDNAGSYLGLRCARSE
jgi:formylglycine-generating enzyme required for sulfatase activity